MLLKRNRTEHLQNTSTMHYSYTFVKKDITTVVSIYYKKSYFDMELDSMVQAEEDTAEKKEGTKSSL
jgi:hypothetical protein